MMPSLLQAEFLKIKRKGFWLLAVLGPFGVVALQMVNYGVRKEYLLKQSDNDWEYFLSNVHSFTPLALVLGIVILTSLMASVENETNALKQWIALPVSKMSVYLSKFFVLASLLFLSSVLLLIFTLAYGMYLDFDETIPFQVLLEYSFCPYFAALPVLAFQLWIAMVSKNQGIPTAIGVVGVIFTFMSHQLPDWMIWKWPTLTNQWDEPLINVWLGLAIGGVLYVAGMLDFTRRDVT